MIVTIQEAIDAMHNGCIVECLETKEFYKMQMNTLYLLKSCSPKSFKDGAVVKFEFTSTQILSKWKIIEEEEELMPCIYCKNTLAVNNYDEELWYIDCDNPNCRNVGPSRSTKEDAIKEHNEIYNKLYNPKTFLANKEKEKLHKIIKSFHALLAAYNTSQGLTRLDNYLSIIENAVKIIHNDKELERALFWASSLQ